MERPARQGRQGRPSYIPPAASAVKNAQLCSTVGLKAVVFQLGVATPTTGRVVWRGGDANNVSTIKFRLADGDFTANHL